MTHKILLDTNSYLRLGNVISPLLKTPFCKNNYELYILPDLYQELKRNPRLKADFNWVFAEPKIEERKGCRFRLSAEQKVNIEITRTIITKASIELENTASAMDIKCLSYGYILNILVITDDQDMLDLAKEFEIKTQKTIELLEFMVNYKFKTIKDINDIVKYWIYVDDLPKDWKLDYKRLFKSEPPNSL